MADDRWTGTALPRPVLTAAHLNKTYRSPGWFAKERGPAVKALQDVSLCLSFARTLGLVGRSGSGKSTLARCLTCLEGIDTGEIRLEGQDLLRVNPRELRRARQQIQLVFQGSASALNPQFSALEIVCEPLEVAGFGSRHQRRERALAALEKVGLPRGSAKRRPAEFSGGERQRLAIARALTLSPKVLLFDESFSGLDLAVQAQLVNLLVDLQASLSISYLFISHDIRMAAHISDEVAVMADGRIVEQAPPEQLFAEPENAHTRALFNAVLTDATQ